MLSDTSAAAVRLMQVLHLRAARPRGAASKPILAMRLWRVHARGAPAHGRAAASGWARSSALARQPARQARHSSGQHHALKTSSPPLAAG
ncbi:MAG: hypothetical protein JF606_22305 [Burkholderiales bacterium]|nr:hypothetical protein [Burkholderiales bacterium]